MRYILAIILPPFAVLLCKRPLQFIVNLIIWLVSIPLLFFMGIGVIPWIICSVHAIIVCTGSSADRKIEKITAAIEARNSSMGAKS